jgi:hypothetical protein
MNKNLTFSDIFINYILHFILFYYINYIVLCFYIPKNLTFALTCDKFNYVFDCEHNRLTIYDRVYRPTRYLLTVQTGPLIVRISCT